MHVYKWTGPPYYRCCHSMQYINIRWYSENREHVMMGKTITWKWNDPSVLSIAKATKLAKARSHCFFLQWSKVVSYPCVLRLLLCTWCAPSSGCLYWRLEWTWSSVCVPSIWPWLSIIYIGSAVLCLRYILEWPGCSMWPWLSIISAMLEVLEWTTGPDVAVSRSVVSDHGCP